MPPVPCSDGWFHGTPDPLQVSPVPLAVARPSSQNALNGSKEPLSARLWAQNSTASYPGLALSCPSPCPWILQRARPAVLMLWLLSAVHKGHEELSQHPAEEEGSGFHIFSVYPIVRRGLCSLKVPRGAGGKASTCVLPPAAPGAQGASTCLLHRGLCWGLTSRSWLRSAAGGWGSRQALRLHQPCCETLASPSWRGAEAP